jgi:hypothetical protein
MMSVEILMMGVVLLCGLGEHYPGCQNHCFSNCGASTIGEPKLLVRGDINSPF